MFMKSHYSCQLELFSHKRSENDTILGIAGGVQKQHMVLPGSGQSLGPTEWPSTAHKRANIKNAVKCLIQYKYSNEKNIHLLM